MSMPTSLDETIADARFVAAGEHADVAVIVVTYRSAAVVDRLLASLRHEATDLRLRVIVADNASPDDTVANAARATDVIVRETGGNLGYAGAINVAMASVGEADFVLILNPDLLVSRGAISAMRERASHLGVGAVVPAIVDEAGETTTSLRREPSVLRGLGDALLGARVRRRPGALAEMIYAPHAYRYAHPVDWATGAALLVTRTAATAVGAWDERFFLYSEETDFFRRIREQGFAVWFEPAAVVRHDAGGSGSSLALETLLAVNRIRYFAKFHGTIATRLFHATAVLNEIMRARQPHHRAILRTVLEPSSWGSLPRSSARAPQEAAP